LGFQVSATGPDHEAILIGDFSTLAEAEAFAESMRQIDAGRSYGATRLNRSRGWGGCADGQPAGAAALSTMWLPALRGLVS
jgi:hypothetical protein